MSKLGDAPSLRESADAAAVAAALVEAVAGDLERSISRLGYPVGMGLAPSPEACKGAAAAIIERISDRALEVLATRKDGASLLLKPPPQKDITHDH